MSEPPSPNVQKEHSFVKYERFLITPFYFGFSAHVLTPNSFARFLGPRIDSPANSLLWFGSHISIGVYLYNSKHLRNAQTFERLLYSIYGSTMFNFGTVLVMSIVRSMFTDNEALRLGIGLSSGATLLYFGKRYINYIDQVFDVLRHRAIA